MNDQTEKILDAQMPRRDFLGWILRGGLFVTFASMILPAIYYLLPITRRGPVSELKEIGKTDEIPVWGAKKVVMEGSVVIVIRTPREFKAFSANCTHLGCIVDWDGNKKNIVCPCHAGLFDVDGQVLSGPPPKPLASHPLTIVGDKIFVKV